MANCPKNVASCLQAQGRLDVISLLEIQCSDGTRIYLSDAPFTTMPLLAQFDEEPAPVAFLEKLTELPEFEATGTMVTPTASCAFENLKGDTVNRQGNQLLAAHILADALFIYREYLVSAEFALITIYGTVLDAEPGDETFELTLRGRLNFSEIKAPPDKIGPNCNLTFASAQCGSTSPTPCQNTWGTCTSQNRFKGWLPVWSSAITIPPTNAYAQPLQTIEQNLKVPQ